MYAGYLNKRNSPVSPPSMQRVYCLLWGTLLFDYENEEESKSSLSPKLVVEILGVSEWDGKGRANNYPGGFLLVTHTGGTYYVSVSSIQERDEWILHLRKALECVFANPVVSPLKPSKLIQNRPSLVANTHCPKSLNPVNNYSPTCRSCGRSFYSTDFLTETCILLQFGCEEQEKVCGDCKSAQMCILWLKIMNYVHALDLHEHTSCVLKDISKYKASFKLRRRLSQRLDMAAELYENGNLTGDEFEELRAVDHFYRREIVHDECQKLQTAIEAFGADMQTIINILLDDNMISAGGRNAYFKIIFRILEISDNSPDLIDFYFPQLYQAYLLQPMVRTSQSYMKIDAVQQLLLVLSKKYPNFAMKLAWNLIASISDYNESKKISQIQYAACMCLLLQLEMVVSDVISSIADKPTSKLLFDILKPALHQQQEVAYEITILFLVRRKLQEVYDENNKERLQRNIKLYGINHEINQKEISRIERIRELLVQLNNSPYFSGANYISTGLSLLYTLGVGQAENRRESLDPQEVREYESDNDCSNSNDTVNLKTAGSQECLTTVAETIIPSIETSLRPPTLNNHFWDGFSEQLDFIGRLNDLVESLRFIDRANRSETLKKELTKWNYSSSNNTNSTSTKNVSSAFALGWDPTTLGGEPQYRIVNILIDECRVFRTKARAPSLIVCEVIRDDIFQKHKSLILNFWGNEVLKVQKSKGGLQQFHGKLATSDNNGTNGVPKPAAIIPTINRAKTSSFDHGVSNQLTLCHNNIGESSFESVTQNIKDVDDFINKSFNSSVIADLQHRRQNESDNSKINLDLANLAVNSDIPNDSDDTSAHSKSEKISSNRVAENVPVIKSTNRSKRAASILPSNRMSTSTEGILRTSSSQLFSTGTADSSKQSASRKTSPMNTASKFPSQSSFFPLFGGNVSNSVSESNNSPNEEPENIDEKVDPLTGVISKTHVVVSAQRLLADGLIDNREYQQLLHCDQQYREETAREEAQLTRNRVENAMGESFRSKKERYIHERFDLLAHLHKIEKSNLLIESNKETDYENTDVSYSEIVNPIYTIKTFIVKTNDDLRQEICCMQIMSLCQEIFEYFGLSHMLHLKPYRIVCTGGSTGIVEVLNDAISLDALKKTPGFTSLSQYFKTTYDSSIESLLVAKHNFMSSLAAYSLFSYILQIKDRHNGNLLIDSEGRIIHIDFGFLLSIAPGGSFSVETAPFKLTEEMVELLDGLDSKLFGEFVTAFTKGFIALQANCENIISALTILSNNSTFPCFQNKSTAQILERLKYRFRTELNVNDAVKHCLDLITNSYGHYGTKQYDNFQYYTNGIMP